MGTLKRTVAFAFILFTATGFGQLNSSLGTLTGPSSRQYYLHTPGYSADEIRTYRNTEGNHIVSWNGNDGHTVEFLLQGSTDGSNFRAIKRIIARSPGTGINIYEATVESCKGFTHFRLIYVNETSNSYSKAVGAAL